MQPTAHAIAHPEVHEAHQEELGFWSKYVFSSDHKIIGIQYGVTALFFLFFGFCLMLMMRWQIAHPAQALPIFGHLLEKALGEVAKDGKISADLYNSFGAMHGTIMVFMAIVPLAFAAFGNYVVPLQIGAPGMTWMRLPFFVWAQFVTAFLLLLAFPPLEAAGVMQLMDKVAHTSFFLPTGLALGGNLANISGGGSPLLWQHLFWFLGHPEVYVLILPAFGIVAEILANNSRKPLWGYKSLVFSVLVIGFLSFVVWAHHMWLTGMGSTVSAFFQTTTLLISIPSVIILSAFFISLWGGSIRFNVPMLWVTAFLPMFGIGGLTGIPLAFNSADLYLHDTYYVIAHFHYIVAPGTIFGLFAGVYYWYPKATGRMMSEFWGKVHFWPSLICMNVIFLPMFLQGMLGMHRRWYDGGQGWTLSGEHVWGLTGFQWNTPISWAAWIMGLAQIPFMINFAYSIWGGKKVESDNPWDATTLEWTAPSPPGHGNFIKAPVAYRGPYEYSLSRRGKDYTMQNEPIDASERRISRPTPEPVLRA